VSGRCAFPLELASQTSPFDVDDAARVGASGHGQGGPEHDQHR
jgi:hypothetical protein